MEDALENLNISHRTQPLLGPSGECLNCSDINFDAYFGLSPEHHAISSISISHALLNIEFCRFCNLLIRTVRHLTQRKELTLRREWLFFPGRSVQLAFFFEREYRRPIRNENGLQSPGGGVMKVRVHPPPWPIMQDNCCFKLCPMFTGPTEDLLHSARFIDDDQIDLSLCRTWLEECQEHHPKLCEDSCRMRAEEVSGDF